MAVKIWLCFCNNGLSAVGSMKIKLFYSYTIVWRPNYTKFTLPCTYHALNHCMHFHPLAKRLVPSRNRNDYQIKDICGLNKQHSTLLVTKVIPAKLPPSTLLVTMVTYHDHPRHPAYKSSHELTEACWCHMAPRNFVTISARNSRSPIKLQLITSSNASLLSIEPLGF